MLVRQQIGVLNAPRTTDFLLKVGTYIRTGASFDGCLELQKRILHCVRRIGRLQIIVLKPNRVFDSVPESWIATWVLEFVIKHKKSLCAYNTTVNSHILGLPKSASKCSLHALALRYVVLKRSEFLF